MLRLNVMDETNILRLLLECALQTRPTYSELYALCELDERSNILHDYLRAFFLQDKQDARRIEMAQRLDNVVSLRLSQNGRQLHSEKLHRTIADYLLRAKNALGEY